MNHTTEPSFNFSFSTAADFTLTNTSTNISTSTIGTIFSTVSQLPPSSSSSSSSLSPSPSPSSSSRLHDPEVTIMVVLGLSLLLAGMAAFLAVCRSSERDGDSDSGCSPGEKMSRGGRKRSSEPQLKVWKRLGSYRRSYNLSFRRPPNRRPYERDGAAGAALASPGHAPQSKAAKEPHLTMPCLFDYVTEI